MQVNQVNSQNFGMAVKKPRGLSASHINDIFGSDTEKAKSFADNYLQVAKNRKKDKVVDIVFGDCIVRDPNEGYDVKFQHSINIRSKKTGDIIRTLVYDLIRPGQKPNNEAAIRRLNESLNKADSIAQSIEEASRQKTVKQILNETFGSGGLFGKKQNVVPPQNAKGCKILDDALSSINSEAPCGRKLV